MPATSSPARSTTRSSDSQIGVQTVETGLAVLSAFVGLREPAMLKTLAERAGMPAAKAHRYVVSLMRCGYVRQDASTNRYSLAEGALRLGLSAMNSIDVVRAARPAVAALRDRGGHSSLLAIWGSAGPTVVFEEAAQSGSLRVTSGVGNVLPLLTSATGRVFAAFLPRELTVAPIAAELNALRQHRPPGAPSNLREVDELLADVRRRGVSRVTGELNVAVHALAAPVFNQGGRIEGVIATLGAAGSFDSRWGGALVGEIRSAAQNASAALGYRDEVSGAAV